MGGMKGGTGGGTDEGWGLGVGGETVFVMGRGIGESGVLGN